MTKARDIARAGTALTNVDAIELGYLDGVTSAVQTQLNQKPEAMAGKNLCINGAFDIWQRGTSFAYSNSAYVFSADRWQHVRHTYATGATASRQSAGLTGFQYCLRIQRDSGNTVTTAIYAEQGFETSESLRFVGKPIVVSFYARAGSNYSGGALNSRIVSGTGTDQAMKNYTGANIEFQSDVTLTTSWQRFSYTGTVTAGKTEFGINFGWFPTGTAGANDYVEITGIQIELGSTATEFTRAGGGIPGELALCQRYFYRLGGTNAGGVLFGTLNMRGRGSTSTVIYGETTFPVTMRAIPTVAGFSSIGWISDWGAGVNGISNATIYNGGNTVGTTNQGAVVTLTTTGATAGNPYIILQNNNTNGYIDFSAEL